MYFSCRLTAKIVRPVTQIGKDSIPSTASPVELCNKSIYRLLSLVSIPSKVFLSTVEYSVLIRLNVHLVGISYNRGDVRRTFSIALDFGLENKTYKHSFAKLLRAATSPSELQI